MRNKDCTSKYLGTNVAIRNNLEIIPRTDVKAGYDEELCIQCSNGYQTLTNKGLRFTQKDQCERSMFVRGKTQLNYEFKYSATAYTNVGNNWNTFFEVNNGCPAVNKCEILEQGCNKPYTGGNLRMNGNTQLEARTNDDVDYSDTICYKCSNARQTQYQDNIRVS